MNVDTIDMIVDSMIWCVMICRSTIDMIVECMIVVCNVDPLCITIEKIRHLETHLCPS